MGRTQNSLTVQAVLHGVGNNSDYDLDNSSYAKVTILGVTTQHPMLQVSAALAVADGGSTTIAVEPQGTIRLKQPIISAFSFGGGSGFAIQALTMQAGLGDGAGSMVQLGSSITADDKACTTRSLDMGLLVNCDAALGLASFSQELTNNANTATIPNYSSYTSHVAFLTGYHANTPYKGDLRTMGAKVAIASGKVTGTATLAVEYAQTMGDYTDWYPSSQSSSSGISVVVLSWNEEA